MKPTHLLSAVLLTALLAGCTDFTPVHANRLSVFGIDVAAPRISTGAVVLLVNVSLDNADAPSGPVELTVKAFDGGTGLLALTNHTTVGVIGKDHTQSVTVGLDLPRVDSYRLVIEVTEAGQIVATREAVVSNLLALTPNLHESRLTISGMDFQVLSVNAGKVQIRTATALTSQGRASSKPLRLQIKAREVSTGLLADEQWIDVPAIAPEETKSIDVTVAVPEHYNYRVEATLWDGSVIVQTGRGDVQLLPTTTQPSDSQVVTTTPDVRVFAAPGEANGDFAFSDGAGRAGYDRNGPAASSKASTPAVGVIAAVAVLAGCAFLARRRLLP